jgi:mannosyltransferase OCH1-like enzyme
MKQNKKLLLLLFLIFSVNILWYVMHRGAKEGLDEKIPRKVFLTWHTKELPPKMRENVDLLKKQNPDFEFFLYDENECREFIKSNFDADVLNAYNKLIPKSYKADLWRFCVMYIHGGIYLDIKMRLVGETRLIDLIDKEHFIKDHENLFKNKNGIVTGILINYPRNPLFMDCINKIVNNVKNKNYGENPLYPTGPGLLGETYTKQKEKYNLPETDIQFTDENSFIYKNKKIIDYYPEYRQEQNIEEKKENNVKHYDALWHDKNIYENFNITEK